MYGWTEPPLGGVHLRVGEEVRVFEVAFRLRDAQLWSESTSKEKLFVGDHGGRGG